MVSAGGKVTAKSRNSYNYSKMRKLQSNLQDHSEKGSLKITSKTAVSVKAKKTTAIKAAATSKAKITYRSSNTKLLL